MFKSILIHGLIAGLIVGGALSLSTTFFSTGHSSFAMAIGYLTMLVGLSAVFIAIKRHRDATLGGVIRFWPALGMGLAISLIAGIIYVAAWDITLALTHMDFISDYYSAQIAAARAKGESGQTLAAMTAEMDKMRVQYANPLYRWPMTFAEIAPVGVLVSLVSAALLRNPRFMPSRGAH